LLAVLSVLAGLPSQARSEERAIPRYDAPNRARYAHVTASGQRLARIDEVPRTGGFLSTADVTLLAPQIRNRWIPEYAIDGSPLTYWSSQEEGDMRWIELDLGHGTGKKIEMERIAVLWGEDYATSYNVLVSTDGSYWRPVYSNNAGNGGLDVINLDRAVLGCGVRVEILEHRGPSVSIIDIGVYGSSKENKPAAAVEISAENVSEKNITLSWKKGDGPKTCFYRIHRSTEKDFVPSRSNLVGTTRETLFIDRGLSPGTNYFYKVVSESFGGKTSGGTAPVKAGTLAGTVFNKFEKRGLVEGFYNDPWPHQERLRMLAFLEDVGMNYYVYAPKMEPYHRQWWRKPYPEAEIENFRELAERAKAHNITFNYGISPGLDMDMDDPADMGALKAKLKQLFDAGVRAFTIALDDIPSSSRADKNIGEEQAELVNEIHKYLLSLDPDVELMFVPTVYSHTPSYWKDKKKKRLEYLEAIASINREVGIMWTGPGEVFSAEIKKEEAMELKKLWNRPVIIWDNYPVNDVSLRSNIFTGPYVGRAEELGDAAGGVLLNPMYLPNAEPHVSPQCFEDGPLHRCRLHDLERIRPLAFIRPGAQVFRRGRERIHSAQSY